MDLRSTVAVAAAATLIILLTFTGRTRFFPASNQGYELSSPPRHSDIVPFTPLSSAREKAACNFCLDGSIPGYHMQKGFGSGFPNWLLHIEGGGWCDSVASCAFRKRTKLGSSNIKEPEVQFSGMLSSDPSRNPDFHNWNKVKIRYCDGGSFSGDPGAKSKNGTQLFFRGQLIWEAIMEQLLLMGLSNARQAFLTGCSAGALATLIPCDDFREALSKDANAKCLADAGLFLNEKDITGNPTIERFYHDVVQLQGIAKGLNKECLSKTEPHKCFFPHEFIKNIQTPLFFVQPGYDYWQIRNILIPDESDPQRSWLSCKLNIFSCSPAQLKVLQGYRNSFLKTLSEFQQNKEGGMFINSCFIHCQTLMADTWNSPSSQESTTLLQKLLVIGILTGDQQSTSTVLFHATLPAITWISHGACDTMNVENPESHWFQQENSFSISPSPISFSRKTHLAFQPKRFRRRRTGESSVESPREMFFVGE